MISYLIKAVVKTRFAVTSRERASEQIRKAGDRYLALAERVSPEAGRRPVMVPCMAGVDEDMRNWSFYMVLEHHVIVNGVMGAMVEGLARGEEPRGVQGFDPKRDVMPSGNAGEEQVDSFRRSVDEYLAMQLELPGLRGGLTRKHPVFGTFDAHQWHCMLGFHLQIHYKQARMVVDEAMG